MNEDSVEPYAPQMHAWADEFDCEYDGWQCMVARQ
jgi:hypothetical protein